ncbi:hypothetical protein L207DRAFT_474815 [Hyaloscypha variabilis F]|uniref:AAA+ ATPase domain-containing protein n=1 Tax=Hyaloscypha variabilis (strain UAMH 11265 / GT02V1 / F) TaxID=1149755 RepID=A0A2J6QTS2_HYAVF|nr:hypothetical protein L207DRAFT_474815 [Hyaloscypha variabilis F]
MATSTPSSLSRNRDEYTDIYEFSSILGKRGPAFGEHATIQPDAKRKRHTPPPAEGQDSQDGTEFDRSSATSSSEDENEAPVVLESDSKPRSTKVREEPFPPTPTPRSKQKPSAHQNSASPLKPPKHVFATRQIPRRHSLSSLYAEDNCKAGAGRQHREGSGPDASCLPHVRKCGFPSVYRISCSGQSSKIHPTFLYEDDPGKALLRNQHQSSHLRGSKPIYQLRDYVDQFQQSSFVIVKNRTCKNQIASSYVREGHNETMIILSDDLRQAIQKVATCPLDSARKGMDELLEMPAPYLFLYRHREPLRAYSQSAAAPLRTMIDAVFEYFDNNYAHEYAEAAELISRGMITRYHLEKLFHPNQLSVKNNDELETRLEDRAMYVLSNWPEVEHPHLCLSFWSWQFDGYRCHRVKANVGFRAPVEDQAEPFPINKLFMYPASFLSEESFELIRKRGKKFWSLRRPNFVHYDETVHRNRADYVKTGRYMIDGEMHQQLHSEFRAPYDVKATRNKQTDPWRISIGHLQEPEEDEFLMMPPKIFGYDFFEKEWVSLSVSNIKPIKWNKQPYEDLVLPEATKNLVKAMVTIRASSIKKMGESANFDIISGKGNGLIMLFHGSPGTGKTLTAESVAEIAEMPLYPITCGDIGTEPDKVEQYLQLVFQLGKRWNCVLLLDEADVFLEERTLTDLQRNSLVSVFLRMLEYYEGILILTSNRVGTFDDAFRSRIHIALHYEDLKPRSRKKIWSNFLTRLEDTEEGENVGEIKDRLDELAKHNLNGREIRNALSTARQLASHGGEKMNWEHLELAIKTANDFGSYLRDVHGHSDREWAREARTR